jgi:hypothetical protein
MRVRGGECFLASPYTERDVAGAAQQTRDKTTMARVVVDEEDGRKWSLQPLVSFPFPSGKFAWL